MSYESKILIWTKPALTKLRMLYLEYLGFVISENAVQRFVTLM
jgi:hypothetical protein